MGNNPQAVALLYSIGTGKLRSLTPFHKTRTNGGEYKATISYAIHEASESE